MSYIIQWTWRDQKYFSWGDEVSSSDRRGLSHTAVLTEVGRLPHHFKAGRVMARSVQTAKNRLVCRTGPCPGGVEGRALLLPENGKRICQKRFWDATQWEEKRGIWALLGFWDVISSLRRATEGSKKDSNMGKFGRNDEHVCLWVHARMCAGIHDPFGKY